MNVTEKPTSFTELINGENPVLIDFYADWCQPCKMMAPILKKVKGMLGDKITIVKIDAEKNQAAAAKYKVRGVPFLVLIQKGNVLWQQAGVVQAEQLKNIILSKIL